MYKDFSIKYKCLPKFLYVFIFIVAYCGICAMNSLYSVMDISANYYGAAVFGYNPISVLMYMIHVGLLIAFFQVEEKHIRVGGTILGCICSLLTVWGTFAHFKNDIFAPDSHPVRQCIIMIGLCFFLIPFFSILLKGILALSKKSFFSEKPKLRSTKFFWISWAFVFLCYVPVFLVNWPGNFIFDAKYQMAEVLTETYKTHHPLIHTLFMGTAYKIGEAIGNVSLGYSFYTLAQMLLVSGCFAYSVFLFRKSGLKKGLCFGLLLWFGLFPMHSVFSITATKDICCAGFFCVFIAELFRNFVAQDLKSLFHMGMLVGSGVLCSLFRNNMLIAVVAGGMIMFFFCKEKQKKVRFLIMLFSVIALTKVSDFVLIQSTGAITTDSRREALSVPLQCMARVAQYRRNEVPEEMYAEICQYIREEDLQYYSPYNSDAVKNEANEELLKTNFVNFMKLWAKVCIAFPGECIESVVTNTMGYWYPVNQGVYVSTDIATYHTLIGIGDEIEKKGLAIKPVSDLYNYLFFEMKYREVPVLGYLFRNCVYVWILLTVCVAGILQKNKKALFLVMIPFMYFGSCMCGPMAALRYLYALVVVEPFLFLVLGYDRGKKDE